MLSDQSSIEPQSATLIRSLTKPFTINHFRWPSGLELLHVPDHGAPVVSYQTWMRVGSSDERRGKTGLAHLFEHLMFKGTDRYPEGEFDRLLEEVGGEVNAATWLDWTYYYVDLPSAHIERVVALEADRILNLKLTDELLEAERQVVINERQECVDDDPCEHLSEILWANMMGEGHPYGHSTIGFMDDIKSLTLEDCQEFYASNYQLGSITLVVCGDVSAEKLTALIEDHYEGVNHPQAVPFSKVKLPPLANIKTNELTDSVEIHAPRVHLGFKGFSAHDPRSTALECLDELLFEGDSARLYKTFIYDLEIASCVYSIMPQFRGEGVYEIVVELLPDQDPQHAISLILDELKKIARDGVHGHEINRVKLVKELQSYRSLQTVQQRAFSLGFWQTTCDDYTQSYQRLSRLQEVNAERVQAVAAELMTPNRRLSVIGLPSSSSSQPIKDPC